MKNKLAHTLILAAFGFGCWLLWGLVTLQNHTTNAHGTAPAFTLFWTGGAPWLLVALPLAAAAYCLWIWSRKDRPSPSWMIYFAITTNLLVLLMLPTLISAYLQVIAMLNQLGSH